MSGPAVCHPDRYDFGRGLCGACYQRARRNGEERPAVTLRPRAVGSPIDPDLPCCDVCAADGVKLVRFCLLVKAVNANGRRTSRGAGVIELCASCWARCKRKSRMTKRLAKPIELRARAVGVAA